MEKSINQYEEDLVTVVKEIFKIIDTYYNEREACQIAELINRYTELTVKQRE